MVSLQAQSVAPDAVANGHVNANGNNQSQSNSQSQSNTNSNTGPGANPLTLGLNVESLDLEAVNTGLDGSSSQEIVAWAGTTFGEGLVLSTSFGIQSAVMLHLVTSVVPDIPVIWVDTGYLPAETYQFAESLSQRLNLNLKVYQSPISPARMEALYGRLWEQDTVEALNRYDQMRKVEPMQRALQELGATAWLAGLRSNQTDFRKRLRWVDRQNQIYKVHPILNWTSRAVYQYLTEHDLPYHPYFDQGYTSVGDWHSSRPVMAGDNHERDSRFRGLKQECGLHLPQSEGESKSLDSSAL
ncbi:MAG: phosphoadenylyl-sulfate reductase [Prochlorothrix sp.]